MRQVNADGFEKSKKVLYLFNLIDCCFQFRNIIKVCVHFGIK